MNCISLFENINLLRRDVDVPIIRLMNGLFLTLGLMGCGQVLAVAGQSTAQTYTSSIMMQTTSPIVVDQRSSLVPPATVAMVAPSGVTEYTLGQTRIQIEQQGGVCQQVVQTSRSEELFEGTCSYWYSTGHVAYTFEKGRVVQSVTQVQSHNSQEFQDAVAQMSIDLGVPEQASKTHYRWRYKRVTISITGYDDNYKVVVER